jgi:hypothetical protein
MEMSRQCRDQLQKLAACENDKTVVTVPEDGDGTDTEGDDDENP